MSIQIAISLADEWEYQVRQFKKTHKKAITPSLLRLIDRDAQKFGMEIGIWNHKDIAHKTCEILAERLGEEYKFEPPRKLI